MKNKNMKVAHKSLGDVKTPSETPLYEILKKAPTILKRFNLTKDQKFWWRWFAVSLVKTNQFSEVDLIHLQQAAFWLSARCDAYAIINKKNETGDLKGMVQTFKGGATNITGWMSIVKDADKALDNISAHFGLSIKDRRKLGDTKSSDDGQLSLFDQFKNRKQQ
ncbi:MAG TPA: hypothetical protein EYG92_06950 [Lutibacter sp.]|nr:hypothetical protein [Lutibacter sp.]